MIVYRRSCGYSISFGDQIQSCIALASLACAERYISNFKFRSYRGSHGSSTKPLKVKFHLQKRLWEHTPAFISCSSIYEYDDVCNSERNKSYHINQTQTSTSQSIRVARA